ncbi:hypothetical protein F2Q70_00025950 [Brassica cretica]|uniref:Uncharacterized protein n=1 Tax=Brassica cretica TaxID=69181 RepID=A0A8S9L4A2_BRACR|nr:hypothetical protein F2Q70_00025950 [Brassica cretica]
MKVFNAALDGSFRESRISHFKAEEAERELFRFRKEVEEQSRRQVELHSRALVRVERRGKRAIVAEMKRMAALFASEFESFKDAQNFVGDFCECRGSVTTLYESQQEDFSFPAKIAEMSGLMNGCAHAESLVPLMEGRVRQLWDSIEVSEDTVEAGTGVGDEVCRGELPPPIPSGVELHPCEQDPSADSCRSFCLARSSPQQAVLLEFLHRRTDSKHGGAPSISSCLSASGCSVWGRTGNLPLPELNPGFSPGERSGTSEVPLPSDFFADLPSGFTTHKSLDEESRRKVVAEGSSLINEGMRVFNAALDGSFRESRISHFKVEEAERELFRFRKEVEEQSRRQAELHSLALVRAERRGKRVIVAEMKRRAALFATEFESFKDAQKIVDDFRECRGSVATLYGS